jgi:predicted alpha/beta-hydrolase family hydrolase
LNLAWQCPADAVAARVLGHGAGAGLAHSNQQAIAEAFERAGIATLRFDFPFMEAGRKRVDSPEVSTARIADAFAEAAGRTELPLWLGGHSFGGRMAAHAVVDRGLEPVGLVFCSFPLHAPGKPSTARAARLGEIGRPMLFLSGTRDVFADRALLGGTVGALPRAELHWLDTADHGYRVLKRARSSTIDVFDEMAGAARAFIDSQAAAA